MAHASLIAAIRAIESDGWLTAQEKTKRLEKLLSEDHMKKKKKNDAFKLLSGSFECSFCMQLLDRPVTMPCGHNFCLKCFEKMASQPRINMSLIRAIRMAKENNKNAASRSRTRKPYCYIIDKNKAFTVGSDGTISVMAPPDHILVDEDDEDHMECSQSVVLCGENEDDEDHGDWFLYTGSGVRDLSRNKRTNKMQTFDQEFDESNEALRVSCEKGYPVRVIRTCGEYRSAYAPELGVRCDGVYRIEKCWRKPGRQGYKVCRYLLVRCDNNPAPWTSDENGDRPRPFPTIKELKDATDVIERKGPPAWDYDEKKGCWLWKLPPPESGKQTDQRDAGDDTKTRVVRPKTQMT